MKIMSKKAKRFEFSKVASAIGRLMPPVAYFLMLLNWYAWKGLGKQKKNIYELAPLVGWWKRIVIPCIMSAVLYFGGRYYIDDFAFRMGDFVRSAYPSILGFAIGLYALVVSSEKYGNMLRDARTKGRARLISVDLAYPIFIALTVTVLNYLVKIDKGIVSGRFFYQLVGLDIVGVLNIYSLLLIYEMVMVVYMDSSRSLPSRRKTNRDVSNDVKK